MSYANCCGTCHSRAPKWTLVRIGDVVVTWACDMHLAAEAEKLQHEGRPTEISLTTFGTKRG